MRWEIVPPPTTGAFACWNGTGYSKRSSRGICKRHWERLLKQYQHLHKGHLHDALGEAVAAATACRKLTCRMHWERLLQHQQHQQHLHFHDALGESVAAAAACAFAWCIRRSCRRRKRNGIIKSAKVERCGSEHAMQHQR